MKETIIVLEDDPDIANLVRHHSQQAGFDILVCQEYFSSQRRGLFLRLPSPVVCGETGRTPARSQNRCDLKQS